ncbi:DEKNAAC104708 [Brettanomyces naardenensis]|uniref:PRA1 family protein n=1 Tax=Brettanomyces naardenensis TaxID=13370 RepID=A0A448YRE3_BRENA|nr:DEKNAAC104708 [Brettanomyces naardenensis]
MSTLLAPFQNINLSSVTDALNTDNLRQSYVSLQGKFSSLKPPQEFFDVRRISRPADFSEIQQRVAYNLPYFQANYIAIVLLLSVYALLTNALLLFVILFGGLGAYGISRLNGGELSLPIGTLTTSQLYTGLLIITLPLGFLASPVSTMMWLIGSSAVTVFSHAALMEKPIETVFEEQV